MAITIHKIINQPVTSNCYLIFDKKCSDSCIIIDPGSEDPIDLLNYIKNNSILPDFILLSHEHFDHIWAVNQLKRIFNVKVLCSAVCAESIKNSKKNMSAFYKQPGFSLDEADIIINQNFTSLILCNLQIDIYYTPGHTNGSVCYMIDNYLFTGDTLIKNEITVTKLPGGNKEKLQKSLDLLISLINNETIIWGGHGDSFKINELNIIKYD